MGIGGAQFSVTNQYAYKTSYEAGIWGDVKKYAIDLGTGVLPVDVNGNPLNAPLWSAATQLDAQAAVSGAVNGWDTQRRIVTINDATLAAVPFRTGNLSPAQQASLTGGWSIVASPPTAPAVLNYLRGDKSNEGINTTSFRTRSHILGDIVYSAAVPVGAPSAPYADTGMTGSPNPGYNAFKAAKALRTPMVYVGSNDGMLHAFIDTPANGGKEAWAYVPKALFGGGDPNDTLHAPSPSFQLGALAFRRGGIPLYSHRFYVNATPRVWDIDFAYTNTSTPPGSGNDWRTMLVGGLGAGGRSVYALDVTTPIAPPPPAVSGDTEATAAGKVLWEFTDANLGYVYDAPTLVKTQAYGWVVLVASGYNNPGGKGFLYVLNPNAPSKAGQLLKKIALPGDTGTDTNPTGLSTIRAFTSSRQNPYVLQAYGGDLKGNVWRFDLSNADAAQWKAEKIATLKDAANKPQPITTGVRIEIDQNNNVDRYLFVGTGKLLDQQDLVDTSVINSFYVIRDGTWTVPEPAPAVPYSRANLTAITGSGIAGLGGAAHRPRVVPGRHRRQPQDQHGRLRGRQRRRVRLLEAVAGPVPRRAVVDALRARSHDGQFGAPVRRRQRRRQRRHRGRHRGGRAHPGRSRRERRDAAGAGAGHDDERPGREHPGQHLGRRHAEAPRDVGAGEPVAARRCGRPARGGGKPAPWHRCAAVCGALRGQGASGEANRSSTSIR